jgi:ribosomal protein L11 methyltransferase
MAGRIFRPFTIGTFTIVPAGEPLPDMTTLPLILGKKGAFGSGEHETTASCLEELAKLTGRAGTRALDLGSGTGILAIAAARLGITSVVAIDIDWQAAVSCADNVRLNGLDAQVISVCGELACLAAGDFDLVMANIYADLHLTLADEMTAKTKPGGCLLLSGIPLQDKFDIQQRFCRLGCKLLDMRILEEYVTLIMQRG